MQVLRGKNENYLHHDTGKPEPASIKSYIKKGLFIMWHSNEKERQQKKPNLPAMDTYVKKQLLLNIKPVFHLKSAQEKHIKSNHQSFANSLT